MNSSKTLLKISALGREKRAKSWKLRVLDMQKLTLDWRWFFVVLLSLIGCTFTTPDETPEATDQPIPWASTALLSDQVNAIAADAQHVWIATDKGINRLNKHENLWISYTVEDGLANNKVSSVAVDEDAVWFGTESGVSKYQPKIDKWTTYTRDDGLPSNRVVAIGVDGNYIWFGTDKGLSRYNKAIDVWALRTTDDGGLTSNEISAIAVEDEYVWFATDKGVSRYDKKIDSWTQLTKSEGLADDNVTTIAVDEDFIWFGTENAGVSLYSNTEQTFVKTYTRTDLLETDKINYILVDGLYVWIGTANEGVQRYIKPVDTWVHYKIEDGLPASNITAMAVDGKYVWFGTYEDGLARFDKIHGLWNIVKKAEGLVSDNIKSIAEQDGALWIGTAMGLSRLDLQSGGWKTYSKAQGLTTNYITRVVVADDVIWVGTSKGVGRYRNNRWKFWRHQHGLPSDFVLDVVVIDQTVWVGTRNGLCRYNQENDKWHTFEDLKGRWINAIAVDDDSLWLGTDRGLAQLTNLKGNYLIDQRFTFHDPMDWDPPRFHRDRQNGASSSTVHVNAIAREKDIIWIGTQGGLSMFDKREKRWRNFTTEDGLPNNNVRTLAISEDALWIGTPSGLGVLPRNRWVSSVTGSDDWRQFNLTQPGVEMGHENVRDICVGDNQIWLGTIGGLGVYSPADNSWRAIRAKERTVVLRHSSIRHTALDGDWVWFLAWPGTSNGEIIRYDKRTGTWTHYMKEDVTEIHQAGLLKGRKRGSKEARKRGDYKKHMLPHSHAHSQQVGEETLQSLSPNDETPESKFRYEKKRNVWRSLPFITQIDWMEVADDSVWFATDGGVLAYNKNSDTWRQYTTRDGLAANKTTTLMVDGNDVWVVLRDNRICRYRRDADEWETHQVVFQEISPDMESYRTRLAADRRYVWVPAQREGVARYDKQNETWQRYTAAHGLLDTMIGFVVVDNNDVWAYGGWGEGLSKYDENTDSWVIIDSSKGLVADQIREVISGVDYMWVLYNQSWWENDDTVPASGFHRVNQTWQVFRGHPESVGNNFRDVQETAEFVWFGSQEHGISRYDKAASSWTVFTEEDGLLNNRINYPTLKADGNFLWLGGSDGISRYDMRKDSWTVYTGMRSVPADVVHAVAVDSRYVYCGTDRGARRYDKQNDLWLEERIVEEPVNDLATDDKYLWIATAKGVTRFDKSAHWADQHEAENGLADTFVKVADVSGRTLWVGTEKGVSKYNTLSDDPNAWETFTRADDVDTMLLSQEYANSLIDNRVTSIAVGDRYVWVGTERGISRYDMKKEVWVTYAKQEGLHHDKVSSICIDGDWVWFGTEGGVSRLNTQTEEWSVFTSYDGLASDQITSIVASDDFVWFGSFDAGVSRYNKETKEWKHFTQRDGLSHDRVFTLTVDEDFLWVGTERGLSRHDTVTDTWTIFTPHFDEEEDRR